MIFFLLFFYYALLCFSLSSSFMLSTIEFAMTTSQRLRQCARIHPHRPDQTHDSFHIPEVIS